MDESEDDPPELQSVTESSDSETEDNIDSDEDGANTSAVIVTAVTTNLTPVMVLMIPHFVKSLNGALNPPGYPSFTDFSIDSKK